jgi:hypothetical protein
MAAECVRCEAAGSWVALAALGRNVHCDERWSDVSCCEKASGGWRCCLECVSLAAAPILLVSMIIVRLGKWLGTAKDGWTKQRVA